MYEAYNDLDDPMKEKIKDLWVIHNHDYIINLSPELKLKNIKDHMSSLHL